MGHKFTTRTAKEASLKSAKVRRGRKKPLYVESRKRDGRYEYLIRDADGERWVSRQAVYHLQRAKEISEMGRDAWLSARREQAAARRKAKEKSAA
jgi:hypothetical protein